MPVRTAEQQRLEDQGLRLCTKCGQTKPLLDGFFARVAPKKWMSWCRLCRNTLARTYREQNAESCRANVVRWKRENRGRVKELDKASRDRIRQKAFAALGGSCAQCGFDDPRGLHIDHKHQAEEGRGEVGRAGHSLYSAIVRGEKDLSELQILCARCNWIKRHENNEHNYKKRGAVSHG